MFFKDKKILIIGGTGSIGKSLLRHVLKEKPQVVRILSRDEYKQYMLQNEFGPRKDIRYLIGDVRDYDRVLSSMEDIDYVFHTAALKHVPACEYNPYEAVLTNIMGSYNVTKAAMQQKIKKVTFTSSDKAISPVNTYGATKLTAERMIVATELSKGSSPTVFSIVRFGNVMGSRGSVIPLFVEQIVQERRITITDPTMTRFMMTVDQAAQLTIKAMRESIGGEIFVLKMPVVLLQHLAKVIVEETCKKEKIPTDSIEYKFMGCRLGEKMYEELMTYEESLNAWELPEMYIIPSRKESTYLNACKAEAGTYRSADQSTLTIEEIRQIIREQRLL